MKRILMVTSSAAGAQSRTRQVADRVVQTLLDREPGSRVVVRDVVREPLPHLDGTFLAGMGRAAGERSAAQHEALARSDALVDELLASDVVVIAAPMYNFGVPSALKAYFDHIARSGVTFRYTAKGPVGLMTGKRAVVIATRGGLYAGTPLDTQTGYVRDFLRFIGIGDVEFVHAEGLAMGEAPKSAAIDKARRTLRALAMPLAA